MSNRRPLPAHYCATCHWPLACSNADCPTIAKSDAPPPALGELARRATMQEIEIRRDEAASHAESHEGSSDYAYHCQERDFWFNVSALVALATGGAATERLLTDALDMANGRGWAMEWPDRYANLVLEASEFTEAWRGKHGDPVKEAGDVLLTYLLALGAAGVSWADAFAACSAKVAEFRTRAPYRGEFTAAHRAALTPERPADA